ncbi:MAG: helix-turn-helix transcriptional regulator [Clostridium sp.]|nr:helix-turn-helix transcriptional regulator [Clostridium sp.]
MKHINSMNNKCPIDVGLNIISGKWKLKILWHLSKNTLRFNELRRKLDNIPQKSLSLQLHELESTGLILRKSYNEVPPRVEYSLTELGKNITPVFSALCDFGKEYIDSNKYIES